MKTLKITNETHDRLQKLGTLGETFDDVIERLLHEHSDFGNIILQVKLVGEKREVYLKHPLYYWTPENYDVFLRIIFEEIDNHLEWRRNVLKRIAGNDKLYEEVREYRSEMNKRR